MSYTLEAPAPKLRSMFRLQWEPAQESWVMLYPEGLVKLNLPAAQILLRCKGTGDVSQLVADLQVAFNEPDLAPQVLDFLENARGNGWFD